MELLQHLVYEYQKGVRGLALLTCEALQVKGFEELLIKHKIDYVLDYVDDKKVNLYFGSKICLEVLQSFGNKDLCQLTPEEDFILGIMLGYSKELQCGRYLAFKGNVTIT